MSSEPRPESIAETFKAIFESAVQSMETAESEQPNPPVEEATAATDQPEPAEAPAEAAPSLDLQQLVMLAMGRFPEVELEGEANASEPAKEAADEVASAEPEPEAEPPSPKPQETAEPEDEEDEDEEDTDWLSQLFKTTVQPEQESEPKSEAKREAKPKETSAKKSEATPTEAKIRELEERVRKAEEIAKQVVLATQLRLWIEHAKAESQAFQNMVRQYGIELSDQTIEDAMVSALGQIDKNPNALYQELAAAALKEMAKQYTQSMRLPLQPQTAQVATRPPEPKTFEDYLELAMREMSERR